jgi:phage-related protein
MPQGPKAVPPPKRVPAAFYRNRNGAEPVREWLKSLAAEDRKTIGTDIAIVERGWPIGMPVCRPLGAGLWEVRSSIKDGIARVIFCLHDGQLVLLNGFVKKTQKTPQAEIDLALRRKREVTR